MVLHIGRAAFYRYNPHRFVKDYLKIDLRNMDELIQERFPNKDLVTLEELIRDYTETLWEMKNDKEGYK